MIITYSMSSSYCVDFRNAADVQEEAAHLQREEPADDGSVQGVHRHHHRGDGQWEDHTDTSGRCQLRETASYVLTVIDL